MASFTSRSPLLWPVDWAARMAEAQALAARPDALSRRIGVAALARFAQAAAQGLSVGGASASSILPN